MAHHWQAGVALAGAARGLRAAEPPEFWATAAVAHPASTVGGSATAAKPRARSDEQRHSPAAFRRRHCRVVDWSSSPPTLDNHVRGTPEGEGFIAAEARRNTLHGRRFPPRCP
jgi:hypothetical protein